MIVLEEDDDDKTNTSKLPKETLWNSSVSVCPRLFFMDGCFLLHPAGSPVYSNGMHLPSCKISIGKCKCFYAALLALCNNK